MALRAGRPYAGAADLRRMELGLAHAFNSTSLRVGDLSWLGREHTHRELSLDIRIWDDDAGELIAWTYFRANGEFNVFVTPGAGSAALFDELLTAPAHQRRGLARAVCTDATYRSVGFERFGADLAFRRGNAQVC
jgi:hypothetical protein